VLDVTVAYGLTLAYPAKDTVVGWYLRTFGEFARPELDLLTDYMAHFPEPGTYVDVGANIGAICLPLAHRFPAWRVVAIEAHRGLSGVLAANALNNRLENVDWHNAAAGAAAGLVRFPSASLNGRTNFGAMSSRMNDSAVTEDVRACALDDVAPADTRLVKVDVEGFEVEVLRGSSRLLKDIKPVWLLEAKRKDRDAASAVVEILRANGYRVFMMFAPFATPNHFKPSRIKPPETGDFNFLALPPGAPNLWDLPEVGDVTVDWPLGEAAYPYLARYGFTGG
jgi:FkbM family methyltransferase